MLDGATEHALRQSGYARICGVDEVGRGPWAGPVVAAAVVLDMSRLPDGLNDSKKLTAARRERLYDILMQTADISIAEASVAEIDRLNILRATFLAMERAVAGLPAKPDYALIDGNRIPAGLPCPAQSVIKGDGKVLSIAAASVVAKVHRDRLMARLAEEYPHYGWHTNAGYGTAAHQQGLDVAGVTPHHRRSFRPVQEYL
ncbi:MAG: ribonuclease HII [Proteobacteria bacterium]|nr:ribonuclease HII [Pseudomonadota bacterium]